MAKHITLLLLLCAPHSRALNAQEVFGGFLTVTPSIGMAMVLEDDGEISSGGLTTFLELDLSRPLWRWSVFAAIRGIGVACSDGCDMGGQTVGAGVSYLRGKVGLGGGLSGLRQTTGWYMQPFLQLSLVHAPYQAQIRVELPQGAEGVNIPFLVGLRVPVG